MLVNRRTFIAKKPHFEEALALLAEYRDLLKSVDSAAVMRVYAIEVGRFDTIKGTSAGERSLGPAARMSSGACTTKRRAVAEQRHVGHW